MIGNHVHPLNSLATQQVPIGGAQVIAKFVEFTNMSLQETLNGLNGFHKQLRTQGGGFASFLGSRNPFCLTPNVDFPVAVPICVASRLTPSAFQVGAEAMIFP